MDDEPLSVAIIVRSLEGNGHQGGGNRPGTGMPFSGVLTTALSAGLLVLDHARW